MQPDLKPLPPRLQAVIAKGFGGPEVLEKVERAMVQPAAGEVLIAVAFAGVNRPDLMQRSGALPAAPHLGDILGLEVAGEIIACGAGVDPALLGTKTMALVSAGGYASHVCAKAAHCLALPEGLNLQEAAALPEGLFTIWHNLFDRGALKAGETLLIEGGASGIGTLALKLARAKGAKVIVTAGGAEKCARLAAMGVTALDYRAPDHQAQLAEAAGDGIDVVLDILGGEAVNRHLAVMAPGGRHIGLSFMQGMIAPLDLGLLMRKGLWLSSSTLRPKSDAEKAEIAEAIRANLLPLLGAGGIRPEIAANFALGAAAEAHRLLESGKNFGKITLEIGDL